MEALNLTDFDYNDLSVSFDTNYRRVRIKIEGEGRARDLCREDAERLRDYLTAWLEFDPDKDLRTTINAIRERNADDSTTRIIQAVRDHDATCGR